jgi:hypothetical protein
MLGAEATMEIRINGQRYKDWHRIPLNVRQELVQSGVFLDDDGTGVPAEMLPTAGAAIGATRRYELTINGAPYDPEHPVPALLASVLHTLGHHGDGRPPFGRTREGPRTFRSMTPTGERQGAPPGRSAPRRPTPGYAPAEPRPSDSEAAQPRPGSSAPSGHAISGASWDASPDEDSGSAGDTTDNVDPGIWDAGGWEPDGWAAGGPTQRDGTVEPRTGLTDGSPTGPRQPAPGATALTSWQGPTSAAKPQPVRSEPHPGATSSRTYGRWERAGRSTPSTGRTRDPGVIVETTSIPRWVVLTGLLVLAVLVVVLLALTGT